MFIQSARRFLRSLFPAVFLYHITAVQALAVPEVVVSIPPLHSLASAVMQGVGQPGLLIAGGQSPHTAHLRPSAMQGLSGADLIVIISPDFEVSLRKPVSQQHGQKINVAALPRMHLLEARSSGLWEDAHSHDEHSMEEEMHAGHLPDFHLWLSTENAAAIVEEFERAISELDPENAEAYHQNARQLLDRIEQTGREISNSLEPVRQVPYLVFHDAYHYFEQEFGLNPAGSVTLSPERTPGVRSVLAVKQGIHERGARCIFHEPQFQPRLVMRIAEETGIRTGELDPMGAALEPGPDLWFELMLGLRDQLLGCLQP